MVEKEKNPLGLKRLNHVSLVCRSAEETLKFYQQVLGFFPIRRPRCFDFEGAWLFNYGLAVHLIQSDEPHNMNKVGEINPKDKHISFQCESVEEVEEKLKAMKIEYMKGRVEEGEYAIDQLFFHDPDGFMIEVCNCENLPVITLDGDIIGDAWGRT